MDLLLVSTGHVYSIQQSYLFPCRPNLSALGWCDGGSMDASALRELTYDTCFVPGACLLSV